LAKDSLDDWIYYFKNNDVPALTKAKGLDKVAQILKIDAMDTKTKYEYEAYIKDRVISRSMLETAKFEGREIGLEQGREIGIEQGKEIGREIGREQGIYLTQKATVIKLRKEGLDFDFIAKITNLNTEKIEEILKEEGLD
jgi:predicted transposase YdaD